MMFFSLNPSGSPAQAWWPVRGPSALWRRHRVLLHVESSAVPFSHSYPLWPHIIIGNCSPLPLTPSSLPQTFTLKLLCPWLRCFQILRQLILFHVSNFCSDLVITKMQPWVDRWWLSHCLMLPVVSLPSPNRPRPSFACRLNLLTF